MVTHYQRQLAPSQANSGSSGEGSTCCHLAPSFLGGLACLAFGPGLKHFLFTDLQGLCPWGVHQSVLNYAKSITLWGKQALLQVHSCTNTQPAADFSILLQYHFLVCVFIQGPSKSPSFPRKPGPSVCFSTPS